MGYGNETPAEMPKPLHVGQRVTARHPVTRHLHDGDVLTVAPNCYRCACCILLSFACTCIALLRCSACTQRERNFCREPRSKVSTSLSGVIDRVLYAAGCSSTGGSWAWSW